MAKRIQSSKAAQCLKLPGTLPRGHHTRVKSFHPRKKGDGSHCCSRIDSFLKPCVRLNKLKLTVERATSRLWVQRLISRPPIITLPFRKSFLNRIDKKVLMKKVNYQECVSEDKDGLRQGSGVPETTLEETS